MSEHEVSQEFSTSWCRALWESMNEGASWGIPRSGTIYQKRGDILFLIAAMPWTEGMPTTAEELQAQQHGDMLAITREFRRIGVEVRYDESFKWPSDGWAKED